MAAQSKKLTRSIIGRRSKNKGNRYERDIAKIFSEWLGIEFRRVPASGGLDIKGDICYKDFTKAMPVIVDTKNNKSLIGASLRKEIVKTIEDAKKSKNYMLVLKDTQIHEDYALLPLSTLFELIKGTLKF